MTSVGRVTVVIPNWNGRDLIGDCLESLRAQTYRDLEIVVVDNGSSDGSADFIMSEYPEARLIALPANKGFAGGVNTGVREATGAHVAVLNNDAIADPNWVDELVRAMKVNRDVGIIASRALQRDQDVLDGAGDSYSVWGLPFPRGRDEPDGERYDEQTEVFAASGSACLIARAVFEELEGFDEDFFAYYEDVDLAFRARLRGWRVVYQPTARVRHHVGATSGRLGDFARFHALKNVVYLYVKDMPGWYFWRYLPRFLFLYGAMLVRTIVDSPRGILTTARALGTVLMKLPSTLRKRWLIQRSRTVAPKAIDAVLYRGMPPIQVQTLRALQGAASSTLRRIARPLGGSR